MKLKLLLSVILISFFGHSQNTLEKKYNAPIATISNGKYDEFPSNDTLIRIGKAVYNTRTQKVVGFELTDTVYSEATLEPELVSRWMSPDPMEAKYPGMSPYNSMGNNPIYYVDPDGGDIIPSFRNFSNTVLFNKMADKYRKGSGIFDYLYTYMHNNLKDIQVVDLPFKEEGIFVTRGNANMYTYEIQLRTKPIYSDNNFGPSTMIEELFHIAQFDFYVNQKGEKESELNNLQIETEAKIMTMFSIYEERLKTEELWAIQHNAEFAPINAVESAYNRMSYDEQRVFYKDFTPNPAIINYFNAVIEGNEITEEMEGDFRSAVIELSKIIYNTYGGNSSNVNIWDKVQYQDGKTPFFDMVVKKINEP